MHTSPFTFWELDHVDIRKGSPTYEQTIEDEELCKSQLKIKNNISTIIEKI